MYINADTDAGGSGIGGPTGQRIETRASITALWNAARAALELAGAEVVTVDFPAVSNYEGDRKDAQTSGYVVYFQRTSCTMKSLICKFGHGTIF
jgi:amidase